MKFAYTILYVSDILRSVRFYEQAFSIARRFIHENESYAEMQTGATTLAFSSIEFAREHFPEGIRENDPSGPPAAIEVAFTTEDVNAAFQQAVAAGATPLIQPQVMPWGQTVSYVKDPDGILVEIASPMS